MDFKFLYNNITKPVASIKISLGDSLLSINYLNYFLKKRITRLFIPNKKYNIALIDLSTFKNGDEYLNAVNGKNSAAYYSRRSEKLSYTFKHINPNDYIDAIFEINSSSTERQGRKMESSYLVKVMSWPNDLQNKWYGVFKGEKLVAYIWSIEMKELILLNRILGLHAYLKDNIMYFILTKFITLKIQSSSNSKYLMYDTFGSINNGLVLFKKRIGFKPYTVKFTK